MDDFWNSWESVVDELRNSGEVHVARELQESRSYLNGLTDGWFEFLREAELVMIRNSALITPRQYDQLNQILKKVRQSLGVNNE